MKLINRFFRLIVNKFCYYDITEIAEFYSPFWYRWHDVKVKELDNLNHFFDKWRDNFNTNIRLIYFNDKRDYVEIPIDSLSFFLRKKEKGLFRKIKKIWFNFFIKYDFIDKYNFLLTNVKINNNYVCTDFYVANDNEKYLEVSKDVEKIHRDFYNKKLWGVYGNNINDFYYELFREVRRLESLGLTMSFIK